MPGGWRSACAVFDLMTMMSLFPLFRYLPGCRPATDDESHNWRESLLQRPMVRLTSIAFFSGWASAAWRSFGPHVLRHDLHINEQTSSLLWLVSSAAGILDVLTGPVIWRRRCAVGFRCVINGAANTCRKSAGRFTDLVISCPGET